MTASGDEMGNGATGRETPRRPTAPANGQADNNGGRPDRAAVRRRARPDHEPAGATSSRAFRVLPAEDQRVALDTLPRQDAAMPPDTQPAIALAEPDAAARRQGVLREARNWSALRTSRFGLRPLTLLTLVAMPGLMLEQTFGVSGGLALPDMARDLNINLRNVVNIIVVAFIISLFGGIAVGWWADRHRRTPLVGVGAIVAGVMGVLTGSATNVLTLGSFRAAGNIAQSAGSVPAFSLLADYYAPNLRGKVFALQGLLAGIAALAAPLLVGGLVTWLGWRSTFRLLGIPLIIVGVLSLFLLREPVRGYFERLELGANETVATTEDEPQSFGEAWRTIWAVRTLRRLFLSEIASVLPSLTYTIYFPFFLAERYGLNAFQRGLLTMPSAVAAIAGAYFGGGLIDVLLRRNPGRVITVAATFGLISSLGVIGYAFEPPLPVLVAATVFFGFGFALVGPALRSIYTQVIPARSRTQGLQVLGLAYVPALLIFLPIAATIQQKYGYTYTFLYGVPFYVASACIQMTAGKFFALDMRNAFAGTMASEEWRRTKADGNAKLLVCRDVDVEYSGVQVLFGVDFDVQQGEIIALLGTNGAGKSTLLRAISGIQEASAGAIVCDGRDITHMPPHEIAARGISHVPGGRGLFPQLSVHDNLQLGLWMVEGDALRRQRLAEVLDLFPVLAQRLHALAGSLSGGEQQQLSLATAMLTHPKLLVIDELSLGLSPAVVGELIEKVKQIRDRGTTVIVVEQSVNVALTIAERAIFLEKGEVKFVGETAELMRRPDILRAVYVKGTGAVGGAGSDAAALERRRRELDTAPTILEINGITKSYGGVAALAGIDLAVPQGIVLGIIGPNGSGKTTLFDIISGFQSPDSGTVRYDGVDITTASADERARRKLVRRFQDARLFPSLTVYETLLVTLDLKLESRGLAANAAGTPSARRGERRLRARADGLIDMLELGPYRDKFVKELSTGLRRIVDLACILAADPKLLLLDEPSSGIAQAESEGLAPLIRRIKYETGCTILIIEHDMPLISRVADELVALERGSVVTRGPASEVLNDERVISSYLGSSHEAVNRSGALT